ncbi:chaplin [Streptomyces longispororuber]|uniref:chaplin n=1 Tax=Streptomyces longispororuber TaxID=68230 RepID=UPI00272E179B|nr:chaplin [Streptomyces longispororuber]MCQ4214074.1 chaplin [Streptomyces longispororuber]
MRQVMRKGLITVAAASGVLAVTGGYAHADSGAEGSASGSPGVASGNSVQVPVNVPVNVCGNTVNVIGLLNPAAGNDCANTSDGSGGGYGDEQPSGGGSHAGGHTSDSPGVGSGNHVQVPVDVPVNVCGNSVDVVGIGNPASGNDCGNGGSHTTTPPGGPEQPPTPPGGPGHPGTPHTPPGTDRNIPPTPRQPGTDTPNKPGTQTVAQPKGESQLAQTGSSLPLGAVIPVGAGALLAGAVLYRRAKAAA